MRALLAPSGSHGTAPTAHAASRHRLELSDGEHKAPALLTSASANLVTSEALVPNQFAILKEYLINTAGGGNTKYALVLGLEPVPLEAGAEAPEKIGEPEKWDSEAANAAFAQTVSAKAASEDASPKQGRPSATTPQTGNVSSRVAQSSFGASQPQPSSVPLVAGRSMPIETLNPYSNRWQIMARVVNKSELRTYSSPKGEGSVFSVDLSDDSGEIRATAFKEVADRLWNTFEVGQTYLISRGQLKIANKKFAALNNNYEITLSYDTQVQHCADAPAARPKTHFRFCAVADIASRPKDAIVDVLGVVSQVSLCTTLTSQKSGKELTKRTLVVADDSGKAIEVTLWGHTATSFPDLDASSHEVVGFKGLRVTEWNERSLSASNSSSVEVDPYGHEEAVARLKSWWEAGGGESTVSLSQDTRGGGGDGGRDTTSRTTTADLIEKGDALGGSTEPIYVNLRGFFSKTLAGPGRDGGDERFMWYSSCPKCNKKVVGDEMSGFNCESCGWAGDECAYRYIAPLQILDADGSSIMTAFNDQATSIIGAKADDMKKLKDTNPKEYEQSLSNAAWKQYVLRVRGKMETYNGITRMKTHVMTASPVKYADEAKLLLADIQKYDLSDHPKPDMNEPAPAPIKAEA